MLPDHEPENKHIRREFWKTIEHHVRSGHKFFEAMDPLHDAFVLWDFLGTTGVPRIICSATGHISGAADEKRVWMRAHLGDEHADAAILVRDGSHKARHATPSTILIDDRPKVLAPFIAAGGIGILHTSAESTIAQLREIFDGV